MKKRPSGPAGCGRVGLGGGVGSGWSPGTEAREPSRPLRKQEEAPQDPHGAPLRAEASGVVAGRGVAGRAPARSFPEEASNTSGLASRVTRNKSHKTLGGKKGQDRVLPRGRGRGTLVSRGRVLTSPRTDEGARGGPGRAASQPREQILRVSGHQPGSCEPAVTRPARSPRWTPQVKGSAPQGGPH